jgi:hypothetical protein
VQQGEASQWRRIVDTNTAEPDDFIEGDGEPIPSLKYDVGPRSIVVLVRNGRKP